MQPQQKGVRYSAAGLKRRVKCAYCREWLEFGMKNVARDLRHHQRSAECMEKTRQIAQNATALVSVSAPDQTPSTDMPPRQKNKQVAAAASPAAAARAAPAAAAASSTPCGHKSGGCTAQCSSAASSAAASSAAHSHAHSHAHAGPPAFRCAVSQSMGRSLVATRAIAAGEIIHREWPLAHLQFAANHRRTAACLTCGRFVGSLVDQMQRVAGISRGELESLPLFSAEDAQLTELVRCVNAPLCDALYCSAAHRDADWKRGHKLLCVGVGPVAATAAKANADSAAASATNKRARKEQDSAAASSSSASAAAAAAPSATESQQHPFAAFCAHAQSQHELFLLAARLAALVECGEASRADLEKYVQRPWEEIVAAGEDEADEEEEEEKPAAKSAAKASAAAAGGKRKRDAVAPAAAAAESSSPPGSVLSHLRSVVSRSFSLLTTALYTHHSRPISPWFTRAWYSRLVGALRLNALAVEHPTPLAEYIEAVDQVVKKLGADAKAAEADSADEEEEEDAEAADQSSSSSSSDADDDDDNDDASDDDVSPGPRRVRADAASSAAAERHRILLALMPLISRAMMQRLEEKMQRQEARRAARKQNAAAAASSDSASGSSAVASGSDHSRIRRPDRDSYPSRHFRWTLDCSAAQHCALRFSSRLFPSYHGSALYPTIAQANHSCDPNAAVDHGQDAEGMLVASRPIEAGEQIMLSYIDEAQDKAERREQLKDYGFECRCSKCMSELSDRGDSDDEDE